MKKIFLLLPLFFFVSCFYSEMQVDYTVKGYDESEVFCWADYPYTQEEVGDTVVPYNRYFIISIKHPEKYGLSLPDNVEKEKFLKKNFLVDEYGEKIDLFVTLRNEKNNENFGLDSIIIKSDEISNNGFLIKVLTPSIPSYEIEFKFEKKGETVHVFSFKINQERKKEWFFIPVELFRM